MYLLAAVYVNTVINILSSQSNYTISLIDDNTTYNTLTPSNYAKASLDKRLRSMSKKIFEKYLVDLILINYKNAVMVFES
jgi:hypothetical protein